MARADVRLRSGAGLVGSDPGSKGLAGVEEHPSTSSTAVDRCTG